MYIYMNSFHQLPSDSVQTMIRLFQRTVNNSKRETK